MKASVKQKEIDLAAFYEFENKPFINDADEKILVCEFCYENNGCYCLAHSHIEISKKEYDNLFI